METIDDEVLEHAPDFIDRQHAADTPFFVWFNTTHMHFRTHPKPESVGQAGRWQSPYHDTMIDHDKLVGALLDKLDELGIAEDTIVVYSTDNGPHMNSWPDGGMTPFRGEKNTNWEGAFRVPRADPLARPDPGRRVSNEIVSHHDWLPTFLAAAGEPDVVDKLKAGHTVGDTTFKVHIDGYDLLPYLTGEVDKSPRPGLVYFSDDGDLLALRFDNWKVVFMEQRVQGTLQIWAEPFVTLRVPKLFNLRTDPFERADITSNTYWDWLLDNAFLVLAAQTLVAPVPRHVRGVPAAAEGGELHDRPGAGEDGSGDHRGPVGTACPPSRFQLLQRLVDGEARRLLARRNSANVARNWPTSVCAARMRNALSSNQSQYVFEVMSARSNGSMRRLKIFGTRSVANGSAQTCTCRRPAAP